MNANKTAELTNRVASRLNNGVEKEWSRSFFLQSTLSAYEVRELTARQFRKLFSGEQRDDLIANGG